MTDDTRAKYHEVLYRLRLSVRYHQRRVRFFDAWDLWAKGLSVMAGTAAFAALWKDSSQPYAALWFMAGITGLTTISLVFGFSSKARLHSDLARKYLELESTVVTNITPTEQFLADVNGKVRVIEAQEPPPLGALITICQNELARQEGHEDHIVPVPFYQRWLAQFFDFEAPKPTSTLHN